MADTYLSDEEVFGTSEQGYLSDAEVFGESPQTPLNSDSDVGVVTHHVSEFGRGAASTFAGLPEAAGVADSALGAIKLKVYDQVDAGETLSIADRLLHRSYVNADPAARLEMRREITDRFADPSTHPLHKAGVALEEAATDVLPVDPSRTDDFGSKAANALGSGFAFAGMGIAGRAARIPPLATVGTAGAALGGVEGLEDALNSGASIEEAYEAAGKNALVGTTEAAPIAHLLSRLDKASGGAVRVAISNALIQGTEEAIQEAFAQIMRNYIASDSDGLGVGYDADRALLEGSGEGTALGATTGGLMGFLFGLVGGRRTRPSVQPQDDALPEGAAPAADVIGEAPAEDTLDDGQVDEAQPPSTRDGLEALLEDDRSVEEIRAADEQTAQEIKNLDPPAAPAIPPIEGEPSGTLPAEVAPPTPGVADPNAPVEIDPTDPFIAVFDSGVVVETNSDGAGNVTKQVKLIEPPPVATRQEFDSDQDFAKYQANVAAIEAQRENGRRILSTLRVKQTPAAVADTALELSIQETIANTKFTLNPEKLAKRIGADPAAVRAILDQKAAIGEIRKTKKAGNYTRIPKRGPLNIVQFIAASGGIQDQGGELQAADLQKKFVPGYGRLVRRNGLTLDEARSRAAEAGYIARDSESGEPTSTISDLLDAIDRNERGTPIFSDADAGEVLDKVEDDQTIRMADLDDDALANVRLESEVIHGTKLTEIEAEEAAKLVRIGTHDIDSAVVEILERALLDFSSEAAESVGEERFDDDSNRAIPFETNAGAAEGVDSARAEESEQPTEPDAGAAEGGPQAGEQSRKLDEVHGRTREADSQGRADDVTGAPAATPQTPQSEVPATDESGQQEDAAKDNGSVVDPKTQRPAKHRLVEGLREERGPTVIQLSEIAAELFGERVKVQVVDKLDLQSGDEVYGSFAIDEVEGGALEHIIAISMASPNKIGTLLHEGGVHYLREIGILNGQRWRLLSSKAAQWREQFDIDDTYADDIKAAGLTGKQAAALLDEEAVAAAIAAYGTATRFNTRIDKIMDSIYRFFERVRSWLKGEGFNSWSDVFDEIMSGDLADEADAAQASRSAESVTQIQRQAERTDEGLFDTGSHKQGSLFQRRTTRRPTEKQMRANIARGRRAVKRVIKTKGDVTNAMRRSETGPINFYWGSKRGGIQHILKQRGEDILDSLVETIGRGVVGPEYDTIQGRKRRDIQYGKHLAVLSLDRHGEKDVWLLTGFEIDPSVESASPITARRSYARPAVGVSRNVGARDDTNVSRRRPSGKSRTKFQHKREGDSTQAGGTESNETRKKDMNRLMGKGQPLDRVMRIPFDMFGGVNEKGEWEPGLRLHKKASEILINANFSDDGRFSFLNGPLEAARAGLIDRYGLTEEYITRERQRGQDERRIMLKGAEVLKSLKDQNVGIGEARVLQAILTGEDINTKNWDAVAAPIRQTIDELGAEAVSLGLVSAESYERNRGTYLHRVYLKHEGDQPGLSKWFSQFMGGKRKKIIGDAFKGRGMFLEVDVPRLTRDDPEFADALSGRPVKGQKYRIMDLLENTDDLKGIESGKTKPLQRMFLPADKKSTKDLVRWTDRGVWEVRQMRGKKAVLWRDYTKAERTSMGEVLDARYTLGKTFMLMSHDLATGRLYADIAKNADWAQTTEPGGQSIDASDFNRIRNDRKIEWVRVPDTNISNSGGKKRWGALAGKFVRLEIWRDLNELDLMQKPSFWKQALTQWKLNKTARSPVVHMNNIMSNLMFMDMADVRLQDLVAGIEAYAKSTVIIRKQPITAPSVRT